MGHCLNLRNNGDGSVNMNIPVQKEPVDHDMIMTPVKVEVKTEPLQTDRPRRSSVPKCDEGEKKHRPVHFKLKIHRDSKTHPYKNMAMLDVDSDSDDSTHEEMPVLKPEVDDTKSNSNPTQSSLDDRHKKKHPENETSRNLRFGKHHKRLNTRDNFDKTSKAIIEPKRLKKKVEHCKVFQCNTCGLSLPNYPVLQKHISTKHGNVRVVKNPPRCTTCNLNFSTQEEYDGHLQQRHRAGEPPQAKKSYPCRYCALAFTNIYVRDAHNAREHNYLCHRCKRCTVFNKKEDLISHCLKAHADQDKAVTENTHTSQAHPSNEE